MYDMTEEAANELDELLTKTIPEVDTSVQGPFIKQRDMMVILDQLSAQYIRAKMLETKLFPAEIIGGMIRRELSLPKTAAP